MNGRTDDAAEREAESLDEAVRRRRERRALWDREGERSIGQNLALIGALGWTIVTPALLGIFLGRWLDRMWNAGIFWTLGLLVAGLAAGCVMAWKRIHRE
ncbi:MAG: ATPase F0F1 [Alphaproteobacteria bacterium]|nr:ATPase F0F1 [Alphaproteobacteria bacterium]